jgi:hypothetical protein
VEPQERLGTIGRVAEWLVTRRQRRTAAVLLVLIVILSLWRGTSRGPLLDDPLPAKGPLAADLLSTIDPNTATADEWAALPGVGPAMAKKIVAFCKAKTTDDPDVLPLQRLDDLDAVPGIGPENLKQLAPYLRFPEPATSH